MKIIKNEKDEPILVAEETLNESIIAIRVGLQKLNLKKTGHNSFSNFDYYQLEDFLPSLNELMLQEKINDRFTIEKDIDNEVYAKLVLIKGNEKEVYRIPFERFETPLNWKYNKVTQENEQVKSMQDIQYLGALNTYYKRYLYINAFGITDGEIIDKMETDNLTNKEETKSTKVTTKEQTQEELENMLDYEYQQALQMSGQDEKEMLGHYGVESADELTLQQKKEAIVVMKAKVKKQKSILDEASEQLKEEGKE